MAETALAFLMLYVLGLVLALFVRPMFGLYTYIAVFYLHPVSRWWGAELPDLRWSLTASIVTLIAVLIHKKPTIDRDPWFRPKITAILIIYTLWMWIQLPWVSSPWHLEGAILFTKYLLLIFLIYSIVDNERDFHGFCLAHVLGCAYFGLLVYLAPEGGRLEGVGGPGVDDANTLGMHLGTGLIFASFMLLAARGWQRWFTLVTIPFILNGIIQTGSRGALVGLVLGGLVTVYLKPKRFRRLYYTLAVLGLVAFIGLANQAFVTRMDSLNAVVDEEQEWDTSASSRIEIAKSQLRMFADHPFGVGHEGTTYLSRDYIDERFMALQTGDRSSHNTVLSVLIDQGLPGIALFALLAVTVIKMLRKLKVMDSQGLPENLGLYRTMIGGSLFAIIGAGMFAQYLKAEVQIWSLVLLVILWQLAHSAVSTEKVKDVAEVRSRRGLPVVPGRSGARP